MHTSTTLPLAWLLSADCWKAMGFGSPSSPNPDSILLKILKNFPTPRLFCGITAGNLDSIVANYTGNGKVRDTDAYSPDGNPWRGNERIKTERRRPDRASLIYTSLARSAFRDIPIVLGGIEASLRRFVHYDFKQEKLRSSFLTDAKADLIVYGMGEKAIVEIASRCAQKESLFLHCRNLPKVYR